MNKLKYCWFQNENRDYEKLLKQDEDAGNKFYYIKNSFFDCNYIRNIVYSIVLSYDDSKS